nr:immunoglobulin heavy chain junction region [Macaca mulatta]MOX58798.1 immunoglobulin heavy chain junction region [Macaca mulatta]MOX59340.1 immunoglobulin heavy chain junction region [Macaca mulatta]MOX59450.1 immunoglobulin heavy chain junction region [Macaca mulatta]MOX59515.1 immunoglobulin heavy chain junction region [Macaca mulatta]
CAASYLGYGFEYW